MCVARKMRKTGVRTFTDSFTPRRFRAISRMMVATSAGSFHMAHDCGKKLKTALPPPAIETVIVST
jgi:hypothetical protein